MIQNYYILAGLIGIYSMVKTNDPVVILVVGILSMFCFTLGFSGRSLSESEKIHLQCLRSSKIFFSYFVSWVTIPITVIFMGFDSFWLLSVFIGLFIAYQIVSIVFWWAEIYLPRRFRCQK